MADVLKLFSELTNKTSADTTDMFALEDASGNYYHASLDELLSVINLQAYTQTEYDNGNVAAGTFTMDCDTNGNSHRVTLTGTATIEVPTKTLTGSQMFDAGLLIIDGDIYPPSWGSNWDWGSEGAPTLTAKSQIGFKRRAGDTKTIAWHKGGFS